MLPSASFGRVFLCFNSNPSCDLVPALEPLDCETATAGMLLLRLDDSPAG
jgi:hypothetical protein